MTFEINLSGKRALVTGVSSGIGLGIATSLAQAGCDVAGCALEPESHAGSQEFIERVSSHSRQAKYWSVDLREEQPLVAWVGAAQEWLGGIDILVSNAGYATFEGAANCTPDQWNNAINLNLTSHWKLSQAAYPALQQSDSPVILITTSNHAYHTIPGCFPYNIAKAGLVALVQSLTIEWGPKIRAVGIAPGFIDTPNAAGWFNTFSDPAAERARTEASHPVGRLGTPEEIGGLCVFLSSPYAQFIAGTTLLADGGRAALMQDG